MKKSTGIKSIIRGEILKEINKDIVNPFSVFGFNKDPEYTHRIVELYPVATAMEQELCDLGNGKLYGIVHGWLPTESGLPSHIHGEILNLDNVIWAPKNTHVFSQCEVLSEKESEEFINRYLGFLI